MKKIIYLLLIIFLIPIFVNAETITYNICKSGCEYSTIAEIINHFLDLRDEVGDEALSNYDIIVNFNDSETYEDPVFFDLVNEVTINGNNAVIISSYFFLICFLVIFPPFSLFNTSNKNNNLQA